MGLDNVQDAALWARYAVTLAFLSGAFQIFLGVFRFVRSLRTSHAPCEPLPITSVPQLDSGLCHATAMGLGQRWLIDVRWGSRGDRLGFVVNFLSHSVISGFTSGAAITIGLSQLPHMMGYKVAKSHYIHETLHSLFSKIDQVSSLPSTSARRQCLLAAYCSMRYLRTDPLKRETRGWGGGCVFQFRWSTFLMGMIWLAFLMTFKYLGKNHPKLKPLRALGPLLVRSPVSTFSSLCPPPCLRRLRVALGSLSLSVNRV